MGIKENVQKVLGRLPDGVELVVAVKARTIEEFLEAIEGGATIIGENYVQEAEKAYAIIGKEVKWHFIGHLQKNKVRKAVAIFDMIETVDSADIAIEIDKKSREINKVLPVLIEVNSGGEHQKSGVLPRNIEGLVREIAPLNNIKVKGLMTIGPYFEHPEDSRPYFRQTRVLFEQIRDLNIPNVKIKYLSMGMTNDYRIAIEEGANIVRLGTMLFGKRSPR